jgi:hypothetical protein
MSDFTFRVASVKLSPDQEKQIATLSVALADCTS